MKIQKKALQTALNQAKPFVGKGEMTSCIMLDGPGGKLIATDLKAQIEIPLVITDFKREIEVAPEVEIPGEDLIADLNELKVGQLKELSDFAGTEPGKKAEMVDAIFKASVASAEEDAKPQKETLDEVLVMDFGQFSGIVRTLDGKPDEKIELSIEKVTKLGDLLETTVDTLSVGGVFQDIVVEDPHEFITFGDFEGAEIGVLDPATLARVALCTGGSGDREFTTNMQFDLAKNRIKTTDSMRIHGQEAKFKGDGQMYVETAYIGKIVKLAKKEKITVAVADDHNHMLFSIGKTNVWVTAADSMAFPELDDLVDKREGESTVTIKNETLRRLIDQAGVVATRRAHKDFRTHLTFNGSLNVQAVAPSGRYEKFEVPYEKGSVEGNITLDLNPTFLLQALKGIGEKVVLGVIGENKPLRITDDDAGFTAIVMPMVREEIKKPEPEVNEDQEPEVVEAA